MQLMILLFLAALSGASAQSVTARDGNAVLTLTKGAVTLRSAGRVIWSASTFFEGGDARAALLTPNLALVAGNVGDWNNERGLLLVRDRQTSREVWRANVPGLPTTLGVLGRTLYASYCYNGAYSACSTRGFDLRMGRQFWEANGNFVARSDRLGLVNLITHIAGYDPRYPVFTRVNGETGKAQELTFIVPQRKNCNLVRYPLNERGDEFIPALNVTSRYIYAIRRTDCGTFVARFDWHGSTDQKPPVYPKP